MIDTYKKDEKLTTNFEPSNDEDVINKTYLDASFSKLESLILILQKEYNELEIFINKRSVEEVLVQKVVRTTIQ